jgi:hypothetical protein
MDVVYGRHPVKELTCIKSLAASWRIWFRRWLGPQTNRGMLIPVFILAIDYH